MSIYANAIKDVTDAGLEYRDPYVTAMEHVIDGLLTDAPGWTGIPVIVSANNHNTDNSETTPARMAYRNAPNFQSMGHVISVGGTELREDSAGILRDKRWVCNVTRDGSCPIEYNGQNGWPIGSNYGNTVDIWAPAHNIESAHSDGGFRQTLRSGTSFAAPLVAGVAARILQVQPTLSPNGLYQEVIWTSSNMLDPLNPETVIDPLNWNSRVVHRNAGPSCSPEYP